MSTQRLLTTGDLAKELGVAAGTVRHYERTGKIHAATKTLGGHRRFRFGDVVEELREHGVRMAVAEENVRVDVGELREADGRVSVGPAFASLGQSAVTFGPADDGRSLPAEVTALAGPLADALPAEEHAAGDNPVYDRLRRWAGPPVGAREAIA